MPALGVLLDVEINIQNVEKLGFQKSHKITIFVTNGFAMKATDAKIPGFCTEFRYLSDGQSGLACVAFFEEKTAHTKKIVFFKDGHVKKIQKCKFLKKKKSAAPALAP